MSVSHLSRLILSKKLVRSVRPIAMLFVFLFITLATLSFSASAQFVHADNATSTDAASIATTSIDTTSTGASASTTTSPDVSISTPDISSSTPVSVATSTPLIATSTDEIISTDATTTSSASSSVQASPTSQASSTLPISQAEGTVQVLVRDGSTIAFDGPVNFPLGTSTVDVLPSETIPTASSSTIPVSEQSVLGVLYTLSQTDPAFSLSGLDYYTDYAEFYLDCVTVPAASSSPACGNWQYEVDGNYPYDSIDQYQLQDGDTLDLYYGSPREVVLATSTIPAGQSFVATEESYDAATGAYEPTTGYTIGITQPNPSDPYSPTEIATSSADANGNATFTINTPGAYGAGIEEDYYSNLTPLTITAPDSSSGGSSSGGGSSSSGGGSTSANIPAAFAYLVSQQNGNGSFINDDITDWSALALALPDAPSSARSKLAAYLSSYAPSLSSPTDYERHAMARLALGMNPYSGTDDITPIVDAFNGTYVGDPSLINDDIFALIVLPHVGYTSSDTIIQKTAAYVVSQQAGNGAWGGSVDLTAAGIQALEPFSSLPGVSSAIAKAESFLRSSQQSDGSFGNSFSTSWALGAIAALGQSPSSWTYGTSTPLAALAALQQPDGGIDPTSEDSSTRTWATAYALTALEGRDWSSLLGSFAKQTTSNGSGTGTSTSTTLGDANGATASTTATSTAAVATSTPVVITATSSIPFLPTYIGTSTPHILSTSLLNAAALRHKAKTGHAASASSGVAASSSSTNAQNNLANVGSALAASGFWQSIMDFFKAIGGFFDHLF